MAAARVATAQRTYRARGGVTPELVAKLKPDVVVLATGSKPRPSEILGADAAHVVWASDVLTGHTPGTKRVVIIDSEGYQTAINAAEYLAVQGRPVEIVTEDNFVAMQLGGLQELTPWYSRAAAQGIVFSPMTTVIAIEPNRVRVRPHFAPPDQERIIEDVDAVVRQTMPCLMTNFI